MKEQTYFHIPTPCHENWDNMTPQNKGRFCASCSKQVVDFSLMSDRQVLNYFKDAAGKVCGRFGNDQLQRPMVEAAEQKKKVWWIAAMMPLLMLFGKANAQKKKNTKTLEPVIATTTSTVRTVGMIAQKIRPVILNKRIFNGTVQNEQGSPIPFANINVNEYSKISTSDSEGNFEMTLPAIKTDSFTISASSIGYEPTKQQVSIEDDNIIITLKEKEINLPTVVVASNENLCSIRLGGAYSVTTITVREKVDTIMRKILHNNSFKIFPNPVVKGSSINIEIKKTGNYSFQLLDANSKPILIKELIIAADKSINEIIIPSSLAAGMYYIRLIDDNKKKQYTDKLIVQ